MTPKARKPVRRTLDVTYRVTTDAVVDDLRRATIMVPTGGRYPLVLVHRLLRATRVPKQ